MTKNTVSQSLLSALFTKRITLLTATIFLSLIICSGCIQQTISPHQVQVSSTSPATPLNTENSSHGQSGPAGGFSSNTTLPVVLNKTIKDSLLDFTIMVPANWKAITTTRKLLRESVATYSTNFSVERVNSSPENVDEFFIITYPLTRNQDQEYLDNIRSTWKPAPEELTVRIHDITFDRFQSTAGNVTSVAYVVRKGSANEKGFASVIYFSTGKPGNHYGPDTYEQIVQSFQYLTQKQIDSLTAEETNKTMYFENYYQPS